MRGIKIGNLAVLRNCTVCIISNLYIEDGIHYIEGTDCNNVTHKGVDKEWVSVLKHKDKLRLFEDKIFNNIIAGREF